jgi:glycosyltransferase involved in cell wall biosynthesis
MSIGLPAVVSDYGGNPYVIEDGENGLLFHNRDGAGLADCVRRLMDDRWQLSQLKENAVKIYSERFTGQIFARNVEHIYMKTLEGVRDGKQTR